MENHVCFFILTNCEAILNKLLIVCIAYILKHILDFILIYIFWTLWYGMYTYSSEILNILKSVINQCLPIFSNEIIFFFNINLFILIGGIGFAIHQHESATGVYVFPILNPPSHLHPRTIPLGHPSAPAPSILYPASNLDWQFISYMITYMFKFHSPKSSHPIPLPQSPKDCSILH